uniref:Uncharacterized protein n=1 Tax=Chromera velia CCMP2878 TaxID=1169474 RepID=A0A0G4FFW7_9ALVE|eukprot:Cvel_16643.t1-p1 / transcript=Cvel_16643.t1 / gene=Cvel_16643 / organism=Chromera_velia_CCMP2878 / gene_product=hypothetical protein / transcript_product=hypothetical protein / location=Cvel_scaffold1290:32651-38681(-) / protein_length=284 / sequence_SO=supercontig / SO=protein_coding / is_pseudo=false
MLVRRNRQAMLIDELSYQSAEMDMEKKRRLDFRVIQNTAAVADQLNSWQQRQSRTDQLEQKWCITKLKSLTVTDVCEENRSQEHMAFCLMLSLDTPLNHRVENMGAKKMNLLALSISGPMLTEWMSNPSVVASGKVKEGPTMESLIEKVEKGDLPNSCPRISKGSSSTSRPTAEGVSSGFLQKHGVAESSNPSEDPKSPQQKDASVPATLAALATGAVIGHNIANTPANHPVFTMESYALQSLHPDMLQQFVVGCVLVMFVLILGQALLTGLMRAASAMKIKSD